MLTYEQTPREKWLFLYPAQVALAGTQIWWTSEVANLLETSDGEDFQVSAAFARLEEGYENALKDYYKKQIGQLNMLIACLLGSLNKGERQKVNSTGSPTDLKVGWVGNLTNFAIAIVHTHHHHYHFRHQPNTAHHHQVMTICTIDVHSRDVVGGMIRSVGFG